VDLLSDTGKEFRATSSERIRVEQREDSNVSNKCSAEQCSKCCCEDVEDDTSDETVKKRYKVATPDNGIFKTGSSRDPFCLGKPTHSPAYGTFYLDWCHEDCSKCSSEALPKCQSLESPPPEDLCCRAQAMFPWGEPLWGWSVMRFPWWESKGKNCSAHEELIYRRTGQKILLSDGTSFAEDLCMGACENLNIGRMKLKRYKASSSTHRDFGSNYC